jgi:hypothetical protein
MSTLPVWFARMVTTNALTWLLCLGCAAFFVGGCGRTSMLPRTASDSAVSSGGGGGIGRDGAVGSDARPDLAPLPGDGGRESAAGVDARPDLAVRDTLRDSATPGDSGDGRAFTDGATVRFGYPDITVADPECVISAEMQCRPVLGGYLLGEQVAIDVPILLTGLGLNVLKVGANVVMALYTDAGDMPGSLVAATAIAPIVKGTNEIPVLTQVELAAGKYWLLALYDVETQIALKKPYTRIWYVKMPFSASVPVSFPAGANGTRSYAEKSFGYFVIGRR